MTIHVVICDQTLSGKLIQRLSLPIISTRTTLQQLIKERVYHEIEQLSKHNIISNSLFIQPTAMESLLNGYAKKNIDPELEYQKAINDFQRHRYIVLVDEYQQTDLNHTFDLFENSVIQFIKMIPLVGG